MVEKKEHDAGHSHEHASKKIKVNFWMVATIVLAVLLLGVLIYSSVTKVSAKKAGQVLTDFAESQGVILNVTEVKSNGAFYEVVAEIQGQSGSFFVTKDGKYFTSSIIPLSTDDSATDTPADDTQTPTPTNVPKSDKPVVELFVMSHCPYGTQMEKAMLPAVAALGNKIDFQIKWVDYAMHGKKELDEQLTQECIQSEQSTKYLSYLQCFLGNSDSVACQKNASIDTTKLKACVARVDKEFKVTELFNDQSTWMSGQFPQFNVDKSDNDRYGVQGSPTLVINGVQVQAGRSPAAALAAVCAAFNTAPSECSTSLPTAQASPGFGYGTSAADAAAVQCGV